MAGNDAAAFAGLIFDSMSIKPGIVVRDPTRKNRELKELSGFTAVFMACSSAADR